MTVSVRSGGPSCLSNTTSCHAQPHPEVAQNQGKFPNSVATHPLTLEFFFGGGAVLFFEKLGQSLYYL